MRLVRIITSTNGGERDRSVDEFCRSMTTKELLAESAELDRFWRTNKNLYERVRAQFFLYAIHRFHLQQRSDIPQTGIIPFEITSHLLRRRFEEAIELLNRAVASAGINSASCSAFAAAFRGLAFQDACRSGASKRASPLQGNQWMSRVGHPADYPLRLRPELLGDARRMRRCIRF